MLITTQHLLKWLQRLCHLISCLCKNYFGTLTFSVIFIVYHQTGHFIHRRTSCNHWYLFFAFFFLIKGKSIGKCPGDHTRDAQGQPYRWSYRRSSGHPQGLSQKVGGRLKALPPHKSLLVAPISLHQGSI